VTLDLTDYRALSFDCYGTLIDWETGIADILGPWARRRDPSITDEDVLVAYSGHEAAIEAEAPTTLYRDVLREAFRRTGRTLATRSPIRTPRRSVPQSPTGRRSRTRPRP
jgi:2-haloacid dehalogenase